MGYKSSALAAALIGGIAKSRAEKNAARNPNLSLEDRTEETMKYTGAAVGGVAGHQAGKYVSKQAGKPYTIGERLFSTGIGATLGYLAMKLISNYCRGDQEQKTKKQ
ncbi:hypothetical protein JW826_06345 [Candidatus Woesearchaeota archaeon]|nr:hypothetical protein [Candidatus Woesearchaeota archaeon]